MKLVNLIKVDDAVYISAGNGYFPRFGYHPVPINEIYKFTDSDKLYVWDGTLLRPSQPEEGDTAYGSDGRYAATYKFGLWVLGTSTTESSDNPACCEQCDADKEVYELRIGNVVLDIDPVQFVADNRELIDAIMAEYLREEEKEVSPFLLINKGEPIITSGILRI